jgi:hypothetical protein
MIWGRNKGVGQSAGSQRSNALSGAPSPGKLFEPRLG